MVSSLDHCVIARVSGLEHCAIAWVSSLEHCVTARISSLEHCVTARVSSLEHCVIAWVSSLEHCGIAWVSSLEHCDMDSMDVMTLVTMTLHHTSLNSTPRYSRPCTTKANAHASSDQSSTRNTPFPGFACCRRRDIL